MAGKHILIVEDEPKIARLLQDYLQKEGFGVACLGRGDEVMAQVRKEKPDLILLDIMLPGLDGLSVCRRIRKDMAVPIIMLTAKVDEVDRIVGLELGADDYVCKPFSPREVVARVKAVLRRTAATPKEATIKVGPIILDTEKFETFIADQPLKLTPNEFALLKAFMSRPNRVFSRTDLVSLVQGYAYEGYDRTIDTHIKNLRKKIAQIVPDQQVIVTVYGMGYKLVWPTQCSNSR